MRDAFAAGQPAVATTLGCEPPGSDIARTDAMTAGTPAPSPARQVTATAATIVVRRLPITS
jgi:hypothetical protein